MGPDPILMNVCDNQGKLFEYSALLGYNSEKFVKDYMSSRIAQRMYSFYDPIQTMDRAYVLEELLDEAPVPRDGKVWDPEAMWWTGYLYRYWGDYKRIGPPAIYGIADGLTMASLHLGYHTLDDEQAIDRLYELHGTDLDRKKARTPLAPYDRENIIRM